MKNIFKTKFYKATETVGLIAFLSVILVQQYIRPNSQDYSESAKHLLGIMPNFLGGIAMSIALFITGKSYFDKYQISPEMSMIISVFISIVGLLLWEYIQVFAHRPFDNEDVMASNIGSLIGALVMYLNILYNKKTNRTE